MINKRSLMIVDDEEDLCEVLSKIFSRLNYETVAVTSVREAFERLSTRDFDLILSDVRMPVADGIELVERLFEEKYSRPNIFLMSGFLDIELPEALHRGAFGLFQKPLDFEVMDRALKLSLEPIASRWRHVESGERPTLIRSVPVSLSEHSSNGGIELGRDGFFWRDEHLPITAGDVFDFRLSFGPNSQEELEGRGEAIWTRDVARSSYEPGCGIRIKSLTESSLTIFQKQVGQKSIKPTVPLGLANKHR